MAKMLTVDRAAPSKLRAAWETQLWGFYVKGDSAGSWVWKPSDTACETRSLKAKEEGRLRDQAFRTDWCLSGWRTSWRRWLGVPGGK